MSTRLPQQAGEWIDREQPLRFSFEGREYAAFEGDTITSALWANGEKALGRSFKYHRPRGILSFANHDINVMVTDGVDTNIRGDVVKVRDGMQLHAVNTSGGVKKDRNRYLDAISALLPVGFYYKAFHTPRQLFPFWENIVRKAAGLGIVNFSFPRITKPKLHRFCNLLVVGAGPAGMAAALAAAEAGLQVFLVDENSELGGSLGYDHAAGSESRMLLADYLHRISNQPNITVFREAYAGAYYTDHLVPVVQSSGITKVRAGSVIVASGAFEQPPVFRNNDLPGVMLGSAAQRLIRRYAIRPFEQGVVLTANTYGYRVALDLIAAGVKILAVVDLRAGGESGNLHDQVAAHGIAIHRGSCVYEAKPAADKLSVAAAVICAYDEQTNSADTRNAFEIPCDGIAMSAGWAGASGLLYQAGTKMRYDDSVQQFIPDNLPEGVFAAGKVNGVFDLQARIDDGVRAAHLALRHLGKPAQDIRAPVHTGSSPSHPYPFVPHAKGKNFVDFDEDLSLKDFSNAAQEGFNNIELMKRFTTVGMGPSQGKHSNMNAIRILAKIRGLPVDKVGTTTSRPFFHPTPIGHLAGRSFHPHRQTAMHTWHKNTGAVFTAVGAWLRPAYYQTAGRSKAENIQQEVLAVRHHAGLIDSSTLGKIEICGPDAAVFLERFYTGSFASQPAGHSRYALLLDESGVIVDDGVVARLSPELFYATTSTANAAAVFREMQRWQQIWQLDIGLVNVTGAYAAMNLAGPQAQAILSKLCPLDLCDTGFPVGAVRETQIQGMAVRIIRVAFVANLAYEIHAPASDAQPLWQAITAAGSPLGLRPFGTEAQRLLRLEMGHLIVGHDTDGLTNPYEIGAEWAIKMEKDFFIGKRSLQIIQKKTLKKRLVPFMLANQAPGEMPQECNLVIAGDEIAGRITSITASPSCGQTIGLAFVAPELGTPGTHFHIRTDSGAMVEAIVMTTPFISAKEES